MAPLRAQLLTCIACFTALSTLAISGVGLAVTSPPPPERPGTTTSAEAPPDSLGIQVDPGDTEIERGTSLQVMVRFEKKLPFEVTLHHQGGAAVSQQVSMSQSLDDPVFACRLSNVQHDMVYHVSYPGWKSPS